MNVVIVRPNKVTTPARRRPSQSFFSEAMAKSGLFSRSAAQIKAHCAGARRRFEADVTVGRSRQRGTGGHQSAECTQCSTHHQSRAARVYRRSVVSAISLAMHNAKHQ
jgi:hypothetical protein